jgi:hypothetical protein
VIRIVNKGINNPHGVLSGTTHHNIKNSFSDGLETAVIGCPKNDIKILLGDVNANIEFKDQDRPVVGIVDCMRKEMVMD